MVQARGLFILCLRVVGIMRLELILPFGNHLLKMACLPIPPYPHVVSLKRFELLHFSATGSKPAVSAVPPQRHRFG